MPPARSFATTYGWLLPAFALTKLAIHLFTVEGYGYFRDELYYLACADHLALGYVDHPPLSIAILAAWRAVFGDSLLALRCLPALTGAATVWLTGWTCRRLGGGPGASALAMGCVLLAPVFLFTHHVYSMNAFEDLVWIAAAALLVRIFTGGPPWLWLALGVLLGFGLLNKISVLWLGFGLLLGLRFSANRGWIMTRWPWLCAIVAFAIFAPHVAWQVARGWPTLQFMRNAALLKMAPISPLDFLTQQLLLFGPVAVGIALAGLGWLLFASGGRTFRPFGVIFVTVVALLLALGSARPSYLAPAYPVVFAAGGVALVRIAAWKKALRFAPFAAGLLLAVTEIPLAPLALPLLPVETYSTYSERLGIGPRAQERTEMGPLPQHLADMFGWPELAAEVARVRDGLPERDRAEAKVFAQNYGEAGAIDFFGRGLGLPRAMSGHNAYWEWGPACDACSVVLVVGGDEEDNREVCAELVEAGRTSCDYCMPYESDLPIWICRGLKQPMNELWPRLRRYI